MDRLNNSFISIEQVKDAYFNKKNESAKNPGELQGKDFKSILGSVRDKNVLDSRVTFSKHANERLESRNINLSDAQIDRLNRGVMQAKEKSINESLVMMDNIAFIVNVKNTRIMISFIFFINLLPNIIN